MNIDTALLGFEPEDRHSPDVWPSSFLRGQQEYNLHAKTDPLILARLDQCISTAKAKHSEADILAAAKALGIADMLPDVTSFDLFKSVTK